MNQIQETILNVYKEVKKICDKNNIRFFAIGGTAIGAVRHKGFIPWDDDMDIAIPNTDWEKFVDCCKKELPEHLKLFEYKKSKHSMIYFNKVHDTRTTFIEKSTVDWKDYHYGIYLDVFPMYGVPENYALRNEIFKILCVFNMAKNWDMKQLETKKLRLAKCLMAPFNLFLPQNSWKNLIEKYQSRYSFDKSKKVGYTWRILDKRYVFDRSWFDDFVELPFESTTVRCGIGVKEILTTEFGDFMQLPPEEKRVSNHYSEIIDCNKSYLEYDRENKTKS